MLQCVGFVRVFTVENAAIRDVECCIDWVTHSTSLGCRRSECQSPPFPGSDVSNSWVSAFAWALMSIYRIRRYLHPAECLSRVELHAFDMSRFVEELLRFAYDHVEITLKGDHGKNPIMPSWFGIYMSYDAVQEALAAHRERATLARRWRWFEHHPESQWSS